MSRWSLVAAAVHRLHRGPVLVGGVVFGALFWTLAASSFAASLTISFETAQVVEGVSFNVHAKGTTQGLPDGADPYAAYKFRPVGGAPCAPARAGDPGTGDGWGVSENAPFDLTIDQSQRIDTPGDYILCGWIVNFTGSTTYFGPVSDQFTVRPAKASVSISLSPTQVTRGQPTTFTGNYQAEIPLKLLTTIKRAGTGCAPTYAADTGSGLTSFDVSGAGSVNTVISTQRDPGSYDICAWMQKSGDGRERALAGPATATFTIVAPPPPDRDGDGVPDSSDRCASEKGTVVRSGCPDPPDRDGDGVLDDTDRCVGQKGLVARFGCPVPASCVSAGALVVKRTANRAAASAKLKKIRKAAAKRPLRRSRRRALRRQERAASRLLKRRSALLKTAQTTQKTTCALPK